MYVLLNNDAVCVAIVLYACCVLYMTLYIVYFFVVPSPIMQCSYVVDVAVHVPWAPDIEVRQPLLIKPPPNIVVSQLEPLPCNKAIHTMSFAHPVGIVAPSKLGGLLQASSSHWLMCRTSRCAQ